MSKLGLVCFACALRCAWSAATVEIIVELPNLSDEVLEPKYQVAVGRHVLQENETEALEGLKVVSMKDSHGRDFSCYLPKSSSPISAMSELKQPDLPSKLLEPLEDACLYRIEEWWTYEFCYQKQIRQFHKHGNAVVSEYILGNFSGNTSEVDAVHNKAGLASLATPYVRERYVNGTPCDIVDKERSTEVRFICAEDDNTALVGVEELHSCAYQITIATSLLCAHPDFKGMEVPVQELKCFPMVEPSPDSRAAASAEAAEKAGKEGGLGEAEDEDDEEEAGEATDEDDQIVAEIRMEDLDEAALDQLISSIIRMGGSADADADFMDGDEYSDEAPGKNPDRTEL